MRNAGRAEVRLSRASAIVAELSITDDGRGFDIADAGKHGKGIGLVSISERVRLVGGTVSIMTELEEGHASSRAGSGEWASARGPSRSAAVHVRHNDD